MPNADHILDKSLGTDAIDAGDETAFRRAKAVDLRRRGHTFEEIGHALGVSRQRAHQLYWECMDAVEAKAVNSYRTEMVEQLAEVVRVAQQVMTSNTVAHSNGRVVRTVNEAGEEVDVIDDGPKLDAGRTIIAALTRLSKLIGADEAVKVEHDSTVRYEVVNADADGVV